MAPKTKIKRRRIDPEKVREMASQGMTDVVIARELGVTKEGVWLSRQRHSIPAGSCRGGTSEGVKAIWASRTAEVIRGMSIKMIQTRFAKRESVNTAYGLPSWLTPEQLRFICALLGGPLNTRELASVLSKSSLTILTSRRLGSRINYVAELAAAGLVASLRGSHPTGKRGGRLPNTHMLTAKAYDLLSNANKEDVREEPQASGNETREPSCQEPATGRRTGRASRKRPGHPG